MRNEPVEVIEYKKYHINIYQDIDAQSPEEWDDNSVFLVGFHRQFSVNVEGFSKEVCQMLFEKPSDIYEESLRERVKQIKREYHFFGLEAYIHSGVVLALSREGNFVDRQWDVSQLGVVFVSKKEAKNRAKAKKLAKVLIEEWNDALSDNVYGYRIEETDDSCWGFFGDYRKSGLIENAQGDIENAIKLKNDNKDCPHEDNITYGKLEQVDGEPRYNVRCQKCGRNGIIMLVEGKNEWYD